MLKYQIQNNVSNNIIRNIISGVLNKVVSYKNIVRFLVVTLSIITLTFSNVSSVSAKELTKNSKSSIAKKASGKKVPAKKITVKKSSKRSIAKRAPQSVVPDDEPTGPQSYDFSRGFESGAKQAFLIDYNTNTVLYNKNGSQLAGPASTTKVMTAYVVFNQLRSKKLTLSSKLCTSKFAANRGGTRMFLKEGSCTDLENLLYGLLTMSGNDAAATIAENIGGSEEGFAVIMNQYAKNLGMNSTHFANPSGLPDPAHFSTARDMVVLAKAVIDDFPEYYYFFSKKVFEFNGVIQPNRNKLLNEGLGVDGFKTGFTVSSGYAIIVSAERNGRRIIGMVNGNKTAKKRLDEARRIIAYGFDEFETIKIFNKNTTIEKMRVWGGETDYVNLYSPVPIEFSIRKSDRLNDKFRKEVIFKEPWKAPIKAGTHAANLAIYQNDKLRVTYPLYTATTVNQGTFVNGIVDKVKLLTDSKTAPKAKN